VYSAAHDLQGMDQTHTNAYTNSLSNAHRQLKTHPNNMNHSKMHTQNQILYVCMIMHI